MRKLLQATWVARLIAAVIALNGFLNLATGLISVLKVRADLGLDKVPHYLQVGPKHHISGLFSVFLGLLLIIIGRGLYERRQRAWRLALVVIIVLMANNLYRGTTPHTAILSVLLIVGLILFRRVFNVRSETGVEYTEIIAIASVLFALAYGIVGSYILRDQFNGLQGWTDALYFTFVTYSTLGYGDIVPKTSSARMFVVSMIPIGLASFVTALTAVIGPMIERRLKGVLRIMKRFQKTEHVIICGYSHVSESAVDELREQNIPYAIIDDRQDIVMHVRNRGHDVFLGDASQKETLDQANLEGATALIAAYDSDSVNILIAITAKEFRDAAKGCKARIVVRVESEESIAKAKQVGADEVISPSTSAGRLMAKRAIAPATG